MSERVALRLTGEIVFTPEKNGLAVEATLAHVEEKIASVKRFKVPWQDSDFHNTVKFHLSQHMQRIGVELASALASKSPTSYLEVPRCPAALHGEKRDLLPVAPLPEKEPPA